MSKNSNSAIDNESLPVTLRKTSSEDAYRKAKLKKARRSLMDEPYKKEWRYWAVIDNLFPYDAAFKQHDLLIPKREVNEKDLSNEERKELEEILDELNDFYHMWLVNFKSRQSIDHHFHIHLLTYKDSREELSF